MFLQRWHSREVPKNLLVDLQKNYALPRIALVMLLALYYVIQMHFFFLTRKEITSEID